MKKNEAYPMAQQKPNVLVQTEHTLQSLFQPGSRTAQQGLRWSLFAGVILWGIGWVMSLLLPSADLNIVSLFDLVVFVAAAHGYVYRQEGYARVFVGLFWVVTFIRMLNTVGVRSAWQLSLIQVLNFIYLAYFLVQTFVPLTRKHRTWHHRLKPVVKLTALAATLLMYLMGFIVFFVQMKAEQNYLYLSSIIVMTGAVLMMILVSGELDQEGWMQRIRRLAPLIFMALLWIFALLDGILNVILLHNRSAQSAAVLFLRPILQALFYVAMTLPAYLVFVFGAQFADRPRVQEALAQQGQAPNPRDAVAMPASIGTEATLASASGVQPAAPSPSAGSATAPYEATAGYTQAYTAQSPHQSYQPSGYEPAAAAQPQPTTGTPAYQQLHEQLISMAQQTQPGEFRQGTLSWQNPASVASGQPVAPDQGDVQTQPMMNPAQPAYTEAYSAAPGAYPQQEPMTQQPPMTQPAQEAVAPWPATPSAWSQPQPMTHEGNAPSPDEGFYPSQEG